MKKLAPRIQKVNAPVIGLDVHEEVVAYTHLDAEGDEVVSGMVAPSCEAIEALVSGAGRGAHVAFEAGGSTLWLYDLLVSRLGRERVHVAQPKRIRAIANSKEKNDANDAWWLA